VGSMPLAQIYTNMQSGVVHGNVGSPLYQFDTQNWLDLCKCMVDTGIGIGYQCGYVMNRDVYNKLPQDVKNVIKEMRWKLPPALALRQVEADRVCIERAKKLGIQLFKFTPEERATWIKRLNYQQMKEELFNVRSKTTDANVREFFNLYENAVKMYEPLSVSQDLFPKR
jgi:TRAP-type C4-dicarboxylate transport system substrate-binding protein